MVVDLKFLVSTVLLGGSLAILMFGPMSVLFLIVSCWFICVFSLMGTLYFVLCKIFMFISPPPPPHQKKKQNRIYLLLKASFIFKQGFAANKVLQHFLHIRICVKILEGHLSMTNLKKTDVKFLTSLSLSLSQIPISAKTMRHQKTTTTSIKSLPNSIDCTNC